MKTKVCECCGKELEYITKNFRKYSYNKGNGNLHSICRECEDNKKREKEWKDGKLLCHKCGKYLPIENFQTHKHYEYRDHREARCRDCKTKQMKKARAFYDDKERLRKILRMRFYAARDRANKKNLPFEITTEFLLDLWEKQDGKCAITNLPMTYINDNGRIYTNVSIDQKEPNKGYTFENTQLVCMAVNQLKSDLSMNEMLLICEAVVNNASKWNKKGHKK